MFLYNLVEIEIEKKAPKYRIQVYLFKILKKRKKVKNGKLNIKKISSVFLIFF